MLGAVNTSQERGSECAGGYKKIITTVAEYHAEGL